MSKRIDKIYVCTNPRCKTRSKLLKKIQHKWGSTHGKIQGKHGININYVCPECLGHTFTIEGELDDE